MHTDVGHLHHRSGKVSGERIGKAAVVIHIKYSRCISVGEENLIRLEKPRIVLKIFEIHIIKHVFGHRVQWRQCICITVSIWA